MLAVSTLISFLSFFLFSDNVRVSLNSTDTVPKDAATNLPEELSQKFPVKAKPEGDGQADEPARDAQTAI